jgi:hypothetical protein
MKKWPIALTLKGIGIKEMLMCYARSGKLKFCKKVAIIWLSKKGGRFYQDGG